MAKSVVITGGSRGIGFAVAKRLVELGCEVAICGRNVEQIQSAVSALAEVVPVGTRSPVGCAADVTSAHDLERVWDLAVNAFDRVDLWINNAALSTRGVSIAELRPEEVSSVVDVNVSGTLLGCRLALRKMAEQGHGEIVVVRGLGSGGEVQPGTTCYGASKASVSYIGKALAKEVRGTNLAVASLEPGMSMTSLFVVGIPSERESQARAIMNLLGDTPEDIGRSLAPRLARPIRNGATIRHIGFFTILGRLLAAPFRKRDIYGAVGGSEGSR